MNDNGVSDQTDIAPFGPVVYEISSRINLSGSERPHLHFVEDGEDEDKNGGSRGGICNGKGWPQD